jgi:hypothetical protein
MVVRPVTLAAVFAEGAEYGVREMLLGVERVLVVAEVTTAVEVCVVVSNVTNRVAVLDTVVRMVAVSEAVVVEVSEEATPELRGLVALEIAEGDVLTIEVVAVVKVIISVVETVMVATEVQDVIVVELGEDVAGATV